MNRRDFLTACASAAMATPSAALMSSSFSKAPSSQEARESSFERVLRTGVLRCAYAEYAPSVIIDPNTRQLSGIFYELTSLAAAHLGLKIEWNEEVDYSLIAEGLKTGRYDLFGGAVWPIAERGKVSNFTNPVYVSPVGIYVRADEKRFQSAKDINAPTCRLAVKDGDISGSIARASFPLATRKSVPQMASTMQVLQDVAANKADATFVEPFFAESFMKANPGTLKNIAEHDPVRVFGNVLMFDNDDWRMKVMLDVAMQEIQGAGVIPRLIEKYTGAPHTFFLVPRSYAEWEK